MVVGITASGTTPYVLSALSEARKEGRKNLDNQMQAPLPQSLSHRGEGRKPALGRG